MRVLLNWRTLLACGFVMLVIIAGVKAVETRNDRDKAFEALSGTKGKVAELVGQIETLQADIAKLQRQLRKAGLDPVVPEEPRASRPAPATQAPPPPKPAAPPQRNDPPKSRKPAPKPPKKPKPPKPSERPLLPIPIPDLPDPL